MHTLIENFLECLKLDILSEMASNLKAARQSLDVARSTKASQAKFRRSTMGGSVQNEHSVQGKLAHPRWDINTRISSHTKTADQKTETADQKIKRFRKREKVLRDRSCVSNHSMNRTRRSFSDLPAEILSQILEYLDPISRPILFNPKLELSRLQLWFKEDSEFIQKFFELMSEGVTSTKTQLHVGNLHIARCTEKQLDSWLLLFKAGVLHNLEVAVEARSGVVDCLESEQFKDAKSINFNPTGGLKPSSINHFLHFDGFRVRLQSIPINEILRLMENLSTSSTFKRCDIEVLVDLDLNAIEEAFEVLPANPIHQEDLLLLCLGCSVETPPLSSQSLLIDDIPDYTDVNRDDDPVDEGITVDEDDLKTENKFHFTSSFSLRDHDFGHHEALVEYPILRDHDLGHHEELVEYPNLHDHDFGHHDEHPEKHLNHHVHHEHPEKHLNYHVHDEHPEKLLNHHFQHPDYLEKSF
ncbi:hypothetical protein CAEBREN_23325 [Caenorhabditis brenneri]|uniref:F-box domain-containing protein n=1 Tax=Caenorhabditis brenneri TaxID=135651 RepID=G0P0M7_CAEBE|nr:hypothetical protein CAEBREN_23325 [Caenorhabditis brenneri]